MSAAGTHASTTEPPPFRATGNVIEQAAQWHAHLQSDDVSSTDRSAFEAWRTQQPAHAEAYARMATLWQRFDALKDGPAASTVGSILDQSLSARRGRNRKMAGLLSLFVVIGAGALALNTATGDYLLADYSTRTGQQRTIELTDHSRIVLNTASAIDVDYSGGQRRITLRHGEILIEVARDPARPFVVETEHGTARALGTQYVVRRGAEDTTVTVLESSVQVCASAAPVCADLHEGEQARVMPDAVMPVQHVNPRTAAAWSKRNLVVDDQPLAEVLRELARYRTGHIAFDEQQIAHLRVSGVFPLADTDRALEVLVSTTPIRVRHYTPLWVKVDTLQP